LLPGKKEIIPEKVKPGIDNGPGQVGNNQIEEFCSGGSVIPDHKKGPQRNGEYDGSGECDANKSIFLFDSNNSTLPFGEYFFGTGFLRGPFCA
jgi:hypothetical protein